jgi:hypothetical protein
MGNKMENVLPSGQMQCAKPSVGKIIRYQHPTNYMDSLSKLWKALNTYGRFYSLGHVVDVKQE